MGTIGGTGNGPGGGGGSMAKWYAGQVGSKVAEVRTTSMRGKLKRQGRFVGRRPDWKKAYVRLKDGEKLPEFIEGA